MITDWLCLFTSADRGETISSVWVCLDVSQPNKQQTLHCSLGEEKALLGTESMTLKFHC